MNKINLQQTGILCKAKQASKAKMCNGRRHVPLCTALLTLTLAPSCESQCSNEIFDARWGPTFCRKARLTEDINNHWLNLVCHSALHWTQGRSQEFILTEARGPQRGPGAEPLVRGSGGEAPLKLKAFFTLGRATDRANLYPLQYFQQSITIR